MAPASFQHQSGSHGRGQQREPGIPWTSSHAGGSNRLILQLSSRPVASLPAAAPLRSLRCPRCALQKPRHMPRKRGEYRAASSYRNRSLLPGGEPITAPSLTHNCPFLLPFNYKTDTSFGWSLSVPFNFLAQARPQRRKNIDKVFPHPLVWKTAPKGQRW